MIVILKLTVFCLFALIAFLFLTYVNKNSIYITGFGLSLIFLAVLIVDDFQSPVLVGLAPWLIGFGIFDSAVIHFKKLSHLIVYISHVYNSITYQEISIKNLCFVLEKSLLLKIGETYPKNADGTQSKAALLIAWIIIVLIILNGVLIKLILLLFLTVLYRASLDLASAVIFTSYLGFFVCFTSFLCFDLKVIFFLSQFFGPFACGWLGHFQVIEINNSKIDFESLSTASVSIKNKREAIESIAKFDFLIILEINKLTQNIEKLKDLLQKPKKTISKNNNAY